jgi:hypothetical protein
METLCCFRLPVPMTQVNGSRGAKTAAWPDPRRGAMAHAQAAAPCGPHPEARGSGAARLVGGPLSYSVLT